MMQDTNEYVKKASASQEVSLEKRKYLEIFHQDGRVALTILPLLLRQPSFFNATKQAADIRMADQQP